MGLNGSGKLNTLTNVSSVRVHHHLCNTSFHHIFLSQMRVHNQQDPMYKHGQAGTTKSSVTSSLTSQPEKTACLEWRTTFK